MIDKARTRDMYRELGGGRIDTALSGKPVKELVEEWKALFPVAAQVGSPVLTTGWGTWPWEGRLIEEAGPPSGTRWRAA